MNHDWPTEERDTPIAAFARAVAASPERPFLDFSGEVSAGETVVTILDDTLDAVVAWLAINKVSAVSVPLNTALRGEFLRHQVDDAGAALVICEADHAARLAGIADQLPGVKRVMCRGAIEDLPSSSLTIEAFDDHRGTDVTAIDGAPEPGDLAVLIYTSGTTGPPKGCMVSQNGQQLRGIDHLPLVWEIR